MRGMRSVAIVGILMGAVTAAQANGVEDNNNCYEQFRGGDMKLAIYYCSRAIQSGDLEQGDMVVALLNRGVAYKNTGNLEMAVDGLFLRTGNLAQRRASFFKPGQRLSRVEPTCGGHE